MHLGPALYPVPGPASADRADARSRRPPRRCRRRRLRRRGAERRRSTNSRLMAWRLAPSRRVLVASPAYLARHGTPASLAELERHRGIFYTNRGIADWRFPGPDGSATVRGTGRLARQQWRHDARCRDRRPRHRPSAESSSPRTAIADGAAHASSISAPGRRRVHLHGPSRRPPPSAKLKALVASLRHAFGNPPYWDSKLARSSGKRARSASAARPRP